MNLQELNFLHLGETFFSGTRASEGSEFLRKGLRAHARPLMADPMSLGLEKNQAIQDLLSYYGLLELAILCSFIEKPGETEFWNRVRQDLLSIDLSTYYPGPNLPGFLLMRLQGEFGDLERGASQSDMLAIFCSFVGLTHRFLRNEHVATFTKLVYSLEEYARHAAIEGFLRLFSKQEDLLHRLSNRSQRDSKDNVVLGFFRFCQFCLELDGLLQMSNECKLLRGGMWLFHEKWFWTYRELTETTVKRVLNSIQAWVPDDPSDEHRIRDASREMQEAIRRLASGMYGQVGRAAEAGF